VCAVAVRPFLSCGFPDVLRLGERWPWTPHDPPSCHRLAARGTRWQTRRRTAPPWAAQGLNQGLLGRDDGTPQLADPHVVRVASQTLDLDLRKPLVARVPVDDHRERVGEVRGRANGMSRARFTLWPAAHCFRRRHRLRVQVSSGAHPCDAATPGSGEPARDRARAAPRRAAGLPRSPATPPAIILRVPGRRGWQPLAALARP